MKVLILDNYDSFTYNLLHLAEQFADDVKVFRNDAISVEKIEEYDKIILSPGPGLPKDAGIMMEVISRYHQHKSILGVCLGMQGLAEFFGASLYNMSKVKHGVASQIEIVDENEALFKGIPRSIKVGRYHSWAVDKKNLPANLLVTCQDEIGTVMGIRLSKLNVRGVQFHPESIMTEYGKEMMENWINS